MNEPKHPHAALAAELGNLDIYLLDQFLRGRLADRPKILDAGCGGGRNLVYFLRTGHEVFAVDPNPGAVASVRGLAAELRPDLPADNFRAGAIEECEFPEASFDVVLSVAVLHFAEDPAHFERMLQGSWRFLRPGGLFFCRLASTIGIEGRVTDLGSGRYRLEDGSDRFLVDEQQLLDWTRVLGGTLLDPIKTSVVQNLRAMTTWVIQAGETP
jgi:tellurite methyltransferase